jgi:hypothetical protein
MRYTLLLVAIAFFAKTAIAGLGWTLEECKQHWGEPTSTKTRPLGISEYTFFAKGFEIQADTDQQGKVGIVSYIKPSIGIDLATQIIQQNAPKASWEIHPLDSKSYFWVGFENGSAAYSAMLVADAPISAGKTSAVLSIGTSAFNSLMEASKKQDAKDQASGL